MALQKREKKMLVGLGIVAVVSGIILYRVFNPAPPDPVTSTESSEEEPATSGTARGGGGTSTGGGSRGGGGVSNASPAASISSVEFQKHATANDCWVIMDDTVFDVTNVVAEYPQYAQGITQYCGTFGFEAGFLAENADLRSIVESRASQKGKIS